LTVTRRLGYVDPEPLTRDTESSPVGLQPEAALKPVVLLSIQRLDQKTKRELETIREEKEVLEKEVQINRRNRAMEAKMLNEKQVLVMSRTDAVTAAEVTAASFNVVLKKEQPFKQFYTT